MKKGLFAVLLLLCSAQFLLAQGDYNDYVIAESKRAKGGGFAMLGGGVALLAGGIAMVYNESDYATAMGATAIAASLGLDVGSIFMFKKSRKILDEAREREEVPLSFLVTPNSAKLVVRF